MTARPSVADLVYAGVRRTDADRTRVGARYDRGALSPVAWRNAIAALYAREARWWAILSRATVADHAIPLVYIAAVNAAHTGARHAADDWARAATEHARHTTPDRVS